MKGVLGKILGAFLCFILGIIWFIIAVSGTVILAIPQIAMRMYGSNKKPVDAFLEFMEGTLDDISKLEMERF